MKTSPFIEAYLPTRIIRWLFVAVLVLMVSFVALLCPKLALAQSVDLGAPVVDKSFATNSDGSLQVDEDGNYTLQLSVTGKSVSSTTSNNAYVIFVADVSGSMANRYGSSTRIAAAKSSVKSAANTILEQQGTQVKLITFSTDVVTDSAWTQDESSFGSAVDAMTPNGGTNWEAALTQAESDAKAITDGDVYIVFVSDGDPTFRTSQVYSNEEYAQNMNNATYRSDRSYLSSQGVYGTGNSDPKSWNFTAANTVASRLIGNDGYTLFTINVSDSENMSKLSATEHYEADDPTTLESALSSIVEQITSAYSYKDVVVSDGVTTGDMVSGTGADGAVSGFVYTTTDAAGTITTWTAAPEAVYDPFTKTVTWDLGDMSLENGKTYTVSFKVKLTQQAFDDAALLASGQQVSSSNIEKLSDDTIVAYANPSTGNTVAYTQIKTVNGEEVESTSGTVELPRPELNVALSTLTLTKSWDGSGTKPSSVVIHVSDSKGTFTQDVTLTGDSWTKTIYVAAGPDAHSYTVTEASQPEGWSLESYEAVGLSVSGTSYAQGTLQGLSAQNASVTITNKQITYEFRILKQGSDGEPLKGATFQIAQVGSQTTTADGTASFTDLAPGSYTVTETEVPAGYTLPGTHTLVIANDGSATWDGSAITNVGENQGITYFQVTVTNEKIADLPETGGIGLVPLTVAGTVLIAVGGLYLLKKGKGSRH